MVDVLDEMLAAVSDATRNRDREALARVRRTDDVLDVLNREIKTYVTSIDPENLSDDEHRRLEAVLAFAFNLESAGDVVERNIVGFLAKQIKRGAELSNSGRREIEEILDAVRANLRTAASIFTTGDERAARVLAEQKEQFRNREAAALKAQIGLLRAGASPSRASG